MSLATLAAEEDVVRAPFKLCAAQPHHPAPRIEIRTSHFHMWVAKQCVGTDTVTVALHKKLRTLNSVTFNY